MTATPSSTWSSLRSRVRDFVVFMAEVLGVRALAQLGGALDKTLPQLFDPGYADLVDADSSRRFPRR